jgi:PEP-CTERM motif-containing protein
LRRGHANPVDVRLISSAYNGNFWAQDFRVTNNLGGTDDITMFDVTLYSSSIGGTSFSGTYFDFPIEPGQTDTFVVVSQGGGLQVIIPWFAYTEGGTVYSGFVATVPEPSTWAMMLIGFAGLGLAGYRTRRARVDASAA